MLKRMRRYAPMKDAIKGCLGKTKWSSEQSAQWAVTNLRRENPDAFTSTVRPYRCAKCKRWHLGHE